MATIFWDWFDKSQIQFSKSACITQVVEIPLEKSFAFATVSEIRVDQQRL